MDRRVRLESKKVGDKFNICARSLLGEGETILSGLDTEHTADKCKKAIEYAFNRGFYNIGESYFMFNVKRNLFGASLMTKMLTKFSSGEVEYAGIGDKGLLKAFRNSSNKNHIDIDLSNGYELSRIMNRAYVEGRSKKYILANG